MKTPFADRLLIFDKQALKIKSFETITERVTKTSKASYCLGFFITFLHIYWHGIPLPRSLNPFIPNASFLYPLKTAENRKYFWCFQGVQKECIGNEWVKVLWFSQAHKYLWIKSKLFFTIEIYIRINVYLFIYDFHMHKLSLN